MSCFLGVVHGRRGSEMILLTLTEEGVERYKTFPVHRICERSKKRCFWLFFERFLRVVGECAFAAIVAGNGLFKCMHLSSLGRQ